MREVLLKLVKAPPTTILPSLWMPIAKTRETGPAPGSKVESTLPLVFTASDSKSADSVKVYKGTSEQNLLIGLNGNAVDAATAAASS